MGEAKILCLQCSDQVCAKHSSSASQGSRPRALKWAWMACISRRLSAKVPLSETSISCSSLISRRGTGSALASAGLTGRRNLEVRAARQRVDARALDHRVVQHLGDHAARPVRRRGPTGCRRWRCRPCPRACGPGSPERPAWRCVRPRPSRRARSRPRRSPPEPRRPRDRRSCPSAPTSATGSTSASKHPLRFALVDIEVEQEHLARAHLGLGQSQPGGELFGGRESASILEARASFDLQPVDRHGPAFACERGPVNRAIRPFVPLMPRRES